MPGKRKAEDDAAEDCSPSPKRPKLAPLLPTVTPSAHQTPLLRKMKNLLKDDIAASISDPIGNTPKSSLVIRMATEHKPEGWHQASVVFGSEEMERLGFSVVDALVEATLILASAYVPDKLKAHVTQEGSMLHEITLKSMQLQSVLDMVDLIHEESASNPCCVKFRHDRSFLPSFRDLNQRYWFTGEQTCSSVFLDLCQALLTGKNSYFGIVAGPEKDIYMEKVGSMQDVCELASHGPTVVAFCGETCAVRLSYVHTELMSCSRVASSDYVPSLESKLD